jgi:hypothetical protein
MFDGIVGLGVAYGALKLLVTLFWPGSQRRYAVTHSAIELAASSRLGESERRSEMSPRGDPKLNGFRAPTSVRSGDESQERIPTPSPRSLTMSLVGELPKKRAYSRLNCDALT